MERKGTSHDSEWLSELRKEARWKEGRLATLCLRGKELPALTGDLSLSGAKLAVYNGVPSVEDPLAIAIAFQLQIVEVCGIVRHVRETPWGSVVGVEFEETAHGNLAREYLASEP